jgi:hypothetical protein
MALSKLSSAAAIFPLDLNRRRSFTGNSDDYYAALGHYGDSRVAVVT